MNYDNYDKEKLIGLLHAKDSTIATLKFGLTEVACLMDNSTGVAGLHLNGDIAKWSDLRTGGKFETWLLGFDDALELV